MTYMTPIAKNTMEAANKIRINIFMPGPPT